MISVTSHSEAWAAVPITVLIKIALANAVVQFCACARASATFDALRKRIGVFLVAEIVHNTRMFSRCSVHMSHTNPLKLIARSILA